MSYISREAAIEIVINYEFENCPDYMRDFATKLKSAVCSDIRTDLQALPAADVVEVVRCRDCRYDHACLTQQFVEENSKIPFNRDEFFCPDGKRRCEDGV